MVLTDSQGCKLTTNGDPRTGTFPQTSVTTCNLNGVLTNKPKLEKADNLRSMENIILSIIF